MRITLAELVEITHKKTPKGQASWFLKHFGVHVEHDCNGVIITANAFNEMVSKKYGTSAANDGKAFDRPSVKLLKKNNAKTLAA